MSWIPAIMNEILLKNISKLHNIKVTKVDLEDPTDLLPKV